MPYPPVMHLIQSHDNLSNDSFSYIQGEHQIGTILLRCSNTAARDFGDQTHMVPVWAIEGELIEQGRMNVFTAWVASAIISCLEMS